MKKNILGFPRIGRKRALKKASENYWKGAIDQNALFEVAKNIKKEQWKLQEAAGIDLIPSNDFSLYDQVLDMTLTIGCIPKRFKEAQNDLSPLDLYFAMARGIQKNGFDITALEMTKWFDTNYHYIVPEFEKEQSFELFSTKIIDEYLEAKALGIETKPVLIGPVTYLLIGKEKETGFDRIDLLEKLLPVYHKILAQLAAAGARYIQFDEPCLSLNLSEQEKNAIAYSYQQFAQKSPDLKLLVANYFDCYQDNLDTAISLPIHALHLDLVRCPCQLDDVLEHKKLPKDLKLSLGLIDGRNIWKNDFEASLATIEKVSKKHGAENIWIAGSCSFLHSPYDLTLETNERILPEEIKQWLAFAVQKVEELVVLEQLVAKNTSPEITHQFEANKKATSNRKTSSRIHNPVVRKRVLAITPEDSQRASHFPVRQEKQKAALNLPLYPTTTIGSFPQTQEVRSWRAKYKSKEVSQTKYDDLIAEEIAKTIRFQEKTGLDVLVHGEFERNDMVEYFGEQLEGFTFTNFGWVQSYGSRCVKPPIIFGDVSRKNPMTVKWSSYAQSLTEKPVKGMLTGPITMLQWSFVRNDQSRATTCIQIALAIRDEVCDLEKAGLKVIQIDEPAIREGLPLRKEDWSSYLKWAVNAFKISSSGVRDETQIHTHMCYSEFNDIISNVADLDADVITIETSRSEMELLDAFVDFKYPNEIGPGVYDIHSPRVPTEAEIENLLIKASALLPPEHIWVNPDCGLKTRGWPETETALVNLVTTAKKMRARVPVLH